MLFHRRPLVEGLSCLVRLRLRLWTLAIMVREHCDRCSSQAVVCEMWLYTWSLWHLLHHVIERSCTKRCAVKPDFVVCGIELLSLTISWSLKHSIWRWIEMAQVVLEPEPGTGKYLRIRFIFTTCEATLVIFCSRSIQPLVVFSAEKASRVWTIAGFHFPVFQKRGQGRAMPSSVTGQDSSCRPVRVRRSQIVSSSALSRLPFCERRQLFSPFP